MKSLVTFATVIFGRSITRVQWYELVAPRASSSVVKKAQTHVEVKLLSITWNVNNCFAVKIITKRLTH